VESLWQVSARHEKNDAERLAAAAVRAASGAVVAWVRGTNPFTCPPGCRLPRPDSHAEVFDSGTLMRVALACFGLELHAANLPRDRRPPLTTIVRHRNGLFLSGYWQDSAVRLKVRLPYGAPAPVGLDTELESGAAVVSGQRWRHLECRVFVDGQDRGVISCAERHSGDPRFVRRLYVGGLKNATVRFLPETGTLDRLEVLTGRVVYPYTIGVQPIRFDVHRDGPGEVVVIQGVSGELLFSW